MKSGDKMVENGLRNPNFTADDFIEEASEYENIVYGIYYVAPGVTMDAPEEWRNKVQDYYYTVYWGIFSF